MMALQFNKDTPIRLINVVLSILMLTLTACSGLTTGELPQDGPKMREVYENHDTGDSGIKTIDDARAEVGNRTGRHIYNGDTDLSGYTRHAHNEIKQLFPTLANPTLIMFIDPHLSKSGAPIPGYSTAFPMYEINQYALPGEKFQ
jgi:conjugative transfer region lipoprotein (TIGR03751 family)